jgi:MFS transporter, SP family, arabinose:H+ symporter
VRPNRAIEDHKTERLFQRKYWRPIFLAVSIAFFNQMIGVNAILYYLNDIFSAAGFTQVSSNLQAVAIGGMNMLATFLALSLIDHIGRKRLLLIGSIGLAVCLSGVSAIFLTQSHQRWLLLLLVLYIGFFAFSQGAVIWVYIGEVFPNRVRAKGQSLGSATHWIMNALISLAFPLIAARSSAYPFIFFAAMVMLQFVVVLMAFPETKSVTLEELQHRLGIEY